MLNDLARAMKALDGKKRLHLLTARSHTYESLTDRSDASHRTSSPKTSMLHGMSNTLSYSSLHGWSLLCTTAFAVKVSKAQTPEAWQGSNLFVPPGSGHNSYQGTSTKFSTRDTQTHAWPSAHDQRGSTDHQWPAFFPSGDRTCKTRITFSRNMAMQPTARQP